MATLKDFFINIEDKYTIPPAGTAFLTNLPAAMIQKIDGAKPLLNSSYNIPVEKYQTVITTSDIHADLLVLSSILFNAEVTDEEIMSLDDVFTIRWNPAKTNTILIIVGDIVDGKRDAMSVPDVSGDIEILLHIFLFNLRISAREYNSELRFLIGNHDYHTVIQEGELLASVLGTNAAPYGTGSPGITTQKLKETYYGNMNVIYNNYVHQTAKTLFGERANRRNCLLPFYEACPYITVTIGNEAIFVHASLHGGNNGEYNMTPKLLELQGKIDELGLKNTICKPSGNNEDIKFISNVNDDHMFGGPLWARYYSYSPEASVCTVINRSPYKMTIVGHCQTNHCSSKPGSLARTLIRKPEYNDIGCNNGGCVLLGCGDASGPRLAFVDIAMSRAFANKGRREEILVLKHDDTKEPSRYYNSISRVNTLVAPGAANELIVVWEAPTLPVPLAEPLAAQEPVAAPVATQEPTAAQEPAAAPVAAEAKNGFSGGKRRRRKTRRRQIKKKTRKYRKYL